MQAACVYHAGLLADWCAALGRAGCACHSAVTEKQWCCPAQVKAFLADPSAFVVEAAPEAAGGGGGAAEEKKEEAKQEEEEEEEDDVRACSPLSASLCVMTAVLACPLTGSSMRLRSCRMPAALWQLRCHVSPVPQHLCCACRTQLTSVTALCIVAVLRMMCDYLHLCPMTQLVVPAIPQGC